MRARPEIPREIDLLVSGLDDCDVGLRGLVMLAGWQSGSSILRLNEKVVRSRLGQSERRNNVLYVR